MRQKTRQVRPGKHSNTQNPAELEQLATTLPKPPRSLSLTLIYVGRKIVGVIAYNCENIG